MPSSSQISDASSESFNAYDYGIVCGCKLPVKMDTSHTPKNPERRFLRCPKSQGFQCKFFKWLDPKNPQQIGKLPEVDIAIEREKMNMWIGECARLRKYHDDDRMKIRELELRIQELDKVNKKLKKKLLFCRIVIMIMCLVMVIF